jgi:hypothetical protein
MPMPSVYRIVALLPILTLFLAVRAGAAEVSGTLLLDPTRLAGGDDLGRVLLYTPDPLEPGSSVSHWDTSASPDLLMEPFASPSLPFGEVDLTLQQMLDIGWPSGTSTITIRVKDGPNSGFNDSTEVAAAPANPGGTTLGGQRLAALEWVAGVWAALLGSSVEINVDARFVDTYECDSGGGVLAAAGAAFLFFDFPNAPRQATWYHGALAESLAGENLSNTEDGFPPGAGDLAIFFNSEIDEECLGPGTRYYYGLDGNTPRGQISFAQVALHEIGHGLGFANFSDDATGALFGAPNQGIPRMPDIFNAFSYDNDQMLHWDVMSNEGRASSAINPGGVVWDGPQTTGAAGDILDASPRLVINHPGRFAGSYAAMSAAFGPPLTEAGLTGDFALVSDGTGDPTLGCDPLVNADEIDGKIAVIDRGTCFFTEKVKNAQNAGAIAAVIVNNVPEGLPPMGGQDSSVTIQSLGISLADGDLIKEVLELPQPPPYRAGGRAKPGG